MNCIIIDDEPLAVKLLEQYCSRYASLSVLGSFTNPLEGLVVIKEKLPDVVFLDIQMPQLTGIDLAKLIPSSVYVIFTTAYRDYAVEGFELKAVDYLVKPISFSRFMDAVQRIEKTTQTSIIENQLQRQYLFIKHENAHVKINHADILYLKGQGDYVEVRTDKKRWMTLHRLLDFETELPADRFIRVHKSYIVHADRINSVEKNMICIEGFRIPISAGYKDKFQEKFLKK